MNNLTGYKSISYLRKILNYLFWFIKCILIFKRPFFIVYKYIKRNTPITTPLSLRNGLKIILSTHPHDIVTAFVVFVKGDYGKVEQGTTVVDIGANIGIFSLYAASMGATRIFAYEPNQEAYKILEKNILLNRFENVIFPCQLAVSGRMHERMRFPTESSPYNREVTNEINNNVNFVTTTTLEGIVTKNSIASIDLLKIDCEGSEYDILFSTDKSVFSKIVNIRMEYHLGPILRLTSFLKQHSFFISCHKLYSAVLWFNKK